MRRILRRAIANHPKLPKFSRVFESCYAHLPVFAVALEAVFAFVRVILCAQSKYLRAFCSVTGWVLRMLAVERGFFLRLHCVTAMDSSQLSWEDTAAFSLNPAGAAVSQ